MSRGAQQSVLVEAERPLSGRRNLRLLFDWRPYLGTESVKQQLSTFRGHVINVSWQKQTIKHRLKGLTEAQ